MRGEETDQPELLDPLRLHRRVPASAHRHGLRTEPRLPLFEHGDASRRCEVERGPVVRGQGDVGHAGGAQRDRERLQREREPQRLVVRERAAGRQVPKRAVDARRVVHVTEHACELQPDLDLQVDRHRRGILADVVRVVGQGEDLRGQSRDQQIRDHVAEVARAVEWHRFLQRRRQLVQLAPQPRLERLVVRVLRGAGGDRRRVLRMEVAPPVHVVAQAFDDELLQQRVVLAVRAEETGVERVTVGGGRAICGRR